MRLVVFGEGMVELRADGATAYGGDAVNTAVYLARQGAEPEFMTAMGTDPASEHMIDEWRAEGVGVDHVLRDPTRTPGVYGIRLGPDGERSFTYDRANSAARNFFALPGAEAALDWAAGADILYLTGITLSIFGPEARARIGALAKTVRTRGGQVVFDTNYRPAGWPSAQDAWTAIAALAPYVTLALPSAEDLEKLRGPAGAAEAAKAWLDLGAREVVLKMGEAGAYLADAAGDAATIEATPPTRTVDTTAAGDAFNAGYVAARLVRGAPMAEAARAGANLAAEVIGWPGAIAPRPVGQRVLAS